MHPSIAGISVGDIAIVCAFDVDTRKINTPVAKAVFAPPNNARIFCPDPDDNGAMVHAGPRFDGVAAHLEHFPAERRAVTSDRESEPQIADVVGILRQSKANVLVNYLPVGSQKATEFYAQACLEAGVAMVNCIPVFIASDPVWEGKFTSTASFTSTSIGNPPKPWALIRM